MVLSSLVEKNRLDSTSEFPEGFRVEYLIEKVENKVEKLEKLVEKVEKFY